MLNLKNLFNILIIVHLAVLQVYLVSSRIQPRIIDGDLINITEARFLARLLKDDIYRCCATIISPVHVLSAAHCVTGITNENLIVEAGVTFRNQTGERSQVKNITVPEVYIDLQTGWDVTVLVLETPLIGSNIQPIALCSENWEPLTDVQIYGWGKANTTADSGSNQMRTAILQVIQENECAGSYPFYQNLTNTMFCASVPNNQSACSGDSGGPAIINGQVCGVILGGGDCSTLEYPNVFTDVMKVLEFITNATASSTAD